MAPITHLLPSEQRPPLAQLAGLPASRVAPGRWPLLIGHRGAPELAPENTLAAFQAAADLGVDGVEFDVQCSADGQPVIFHDDALDRMTNGRGPLAAQPLAALRRLHVSGRERIPTLRETFDLLAPTDLLFLIELKDPERYPGIEAQTVALIREYGLVDRAQVVSFDHRSLHHVYGLAPEIRLAELWDTHLPDAPRVTFKTVDAFYGLYTPETIAALHQRGQEASAWTVNEPDEARRLIDAGIDALTTDVPDRLLPLYG